MLVALGMAAALSAAWAPSAKFSLVCGGTQTGYQDPAPGYTTYGAARINFPWSETFTIDLTAGTFCSQGCAKPEPIFAISGAVLSLANTVSPEASEIKSFNVAGGTYQSSEVVGEAAANRFHLEKSGTCTIKP